MESLWTFIGRFSRRCWPPAEIRMRGIVVMASQISSGPSSRAGWQNRFLQALARLAVPAVAGGFLIASAGAVAQSAAGPGDSGRASRVRPENRILGNHPGEPVPPRVVQAERFLARRGLKPGQPFVRRPIRPGFSPDLRLGPTPAAASSNSSNATWQSLGPTAVLTPNFGMVTGRI